MKTKLSINQIVPLLVNENQYFELEYVCEKTGVRYAFLIQKGDNIKILLNGTNEELTKHYKNGRK